MGKGLGWVGFDFDRTIAHYEHFIQGVLGEPIPPMIDLMKKYLSDGYEVRIVTARYDNGEEEIRAIKDWCKRYVGQELRVTNCKDFEMLVLYDDRAIQVEPNTGRIIEDTIIRG